MVDKEIGDIFCMAEIFRVIRFPVHHGEAIQPPCLSACPGRNADIIGAVVPVEFADFARFRIIVYYVGA